LMAADVVQQVVGTDTLATGLTVSTYTALLLVSVWPLPSLTITLKEVGVDTVGAVRDTPYSDPPALETQPVTEVEEVPMVTWTLYESLPVPYNLKYTQTDPPEDVVVTLSLAGATTAILEDVACAGSTGVTTAMNEKSMAIIRSMLKLMCVLFTISICFYLHF
jgi:hypothetical protein